MTSMENYLKSVKEKIADVSLVIMGNEAADLDSMASSIAYGYLRTLQNPDQLVLPLMPIARADFPLRTEAVFVMQEASINPEDLVFFDDIDAADLLAKTDLVLVDHNAASPAVSAFNPKVVGILDHHNDEGAFPQADPRIIQTIGSTTSIIARLFFENDISVSQDLAVLLCGTILLDTVNLDDSAGRVTAADKEIAARLLPLCPLSQEDFFARVQEAKFSVEGLSSTDLLRKDYKQWTLGNTNCGIGSALIPVQEWALMDSNIAAAFTEFSKDRKLDLLLSMNAFTNPDFHRDLVIFAKDENAHDQLLACLQENGLDLKIVSVEGQKTPTTGFIQFYQQGNLGISRKKMQPILAAFFGSD